MSSYKDHTSAGTNQFGVMVEHSWLEDCLRRLAWVYGDPEARMEANKPDVESWRRLGTGRAA